MTAQQSPNGVASPKGETPNVSGVVLGLIPIPGGAVLTSLACMGNSLLDFVMALVRDPNAAARYAADPAGALTDANLPGVTMTDVANLIPVVTDSLAMATPDFGPGAADTVNVWTSGAAAAAFDAFDIPQPVPTVQPVAPQVSTASVDYVDDIGAAPIPEVAPEPIVVDPVLDHPAVESGSQGWTDDGRWQPHDSQADHPPAEHPGFDLF